MPGSRIKADIARILGRELSGFRSSMTDDPADRPCAPVPEYGPRGRLIGRASADQVVASRPRDDVPEVLAGLGTSILTTSRGVMTGKAAVRAGVGGEVRCNIW